MMTAAELRSAIQSARRSLRPGQATFLDALLQVAPAADWAVSLERDAGIKVLLSGDDAAPDFTTIDVTTSRSLGGVPIRLQGIAPVHLALADPWDVAALRRASALLGTAPRLVAATSLQLERWWSAGVDPGRTVASGREGQARPAEGAVVDFVNSAIAEAFDAGASDIHFECDRSGVNVRLRKDGVLSRFARLDDARLAEEVISRIKVLAQLDITERRVPQDGRFRFAAGRGGIDLRVSIMPSVFGEDAVLRLLDKAQMRGTESATTLDRLGFDAESARRIRALGELPHGMLLVTGPTGSGKTTTVYALLSEVDNGLEKIVTIEDPVEYELPGVLQIPVNERKGLTFAKGLRSILRHDPDRILVGEIRDAETAEIAVQSSLTGHQVFTTVHANSLLDVIGRFRHFSLDMFAFTGALNGVVVQRLLRRLCTECRAPRRPTDPERAWLASQGSEPEPASMASATGCPHCGGSGYRGRTVIAEVHVVDDGFRDLVTTAMPLSALRDYVAGRGVASLAEQSARLVWQGVTTMEEIKRVVGWQPTV